MSFGITRRAKASWQGTDSDGGGRLVVDDDGPGVPERERDEVFERFSRGKGGGSGLGLAIVAQQARLHGGDAHVEDSPLGGARFVVDLPGSLT